MTIEMTTYQEEIENNNEEVAKNEVPREQKQTAIKVSQEQQEELKKYKEERGDKNLVGIVADMLDAYKEKEKLEAFNNVAILEAAQGALDTLGKCFELIESNKDKYVQSKLLEMQGNINAIEEKKKNLENKLELKVRELIAVENELKHFQQVINGKDAIIKEREELLDEIKTQKEKVEKEKNDLEKKLNEKDSNFNSMFKELDRCRSISEDLEKKLEEEIQNRQEEINRSEFFLKQEYALKTTDLKSKIEKIEAELSEKNTEVKELSSKVVELKATLEAKDSIIGDIKYNNSREIKKLKESFETEEKTLKDRINKLESYKVKTDSKIQEMQEKEDIIDNLKKDLITLKDEHKEEIKSYKAKVDSKVQEIEEKESDIKELKRGHKEEIKEYKDEIVALKGELSKLKEDHKLQVSENKNYYENIIKQSQEQIRMLLNDISDEE